MLTRMRRFNSVYEVWVFMRVIVLWALVPVLLRLPLSRVLRLLTPGRPPLGTVPAEQMLLFGNYWFSRSFTRQRTPCLRRSLVLYAMLNRYSLPVTIRIGVRKLDADLLSGHSWLESAEGVLGKEPDLTQYTVMVMYPEQPSSLPRGL